MHAECGHAIHEASHRAHPPRRRRAATDAAPLTTPIYETTTFVFENAEEVRDYNEGKSGEVSLLALCEPDRRRRRAEAGGARRGRGGARASPAARRRRRPRCWRWRRAGDEIVCSAAIYGGTLHLLADLLPKFGITRAVRDASTSCASPRRARRRTDQGRLVRVADQSRRCAASTSPRSPRACRARGVISVIDNTFASPINQQPIALGVDIVMHSATKYLNGHSDVTAGVLAGSAGAHGRDAEDAQAAAAAILDPYPAYALGRGLKTLSVRDGAAQRQRAGGRALAASRTGGWQTVYYPGLEPHPDHAIAKKQMRGFGGMVCVDVGGGYERAARFFDRLQVFKRAASLGGVESLCSLPVLTSQWGHTDEELARAGVTHSMARLSVGLEDPEDLIADLDQALANERSCPG